MDLRTQETVLRLAEKHGDDLVVLLGAPDPEAAEISAETLVSGDPTYAGPLAGVQLGLDVYHLLDPEVRGAIPDDVWEEQVGVMADVLDAEGVTAAVRAMRKQE